MECLRCHASLPDSAEFCSHCGIKLRLTTCPICGGTMRAGQDRCERCDQAAADAPQPPRDEAKPHPALARVRRAASMSADGTADRVAVPVLARVRQAASTHRRWFVVLLVPVVVILAMIVWVVFFRPPKPKPTPTPTASLTQIPICATSVTEAQNLAAHADWQGTLDLVKSLRTKDPACAPAEVSGLILRACRGLAVAAEQISDAATARSNCDCVLAEQPQDAPARACRERADAYEAARKAADKGDRASAIAGYEKVRAGGSGYGDVSGLLYELYLAEGDRLCALLTPEVVVQGRAQYDKAFAVAQGRPEAAARRNACVPPTATPAPTATPLPPVSAAVTGTEVLRIRTGPGMGYPILGTVPATATLTALGRSANGDWINLSADSARVGWASAEYVRLVVSFPVSALGQVPAPPLPKRALVAESWTDFSPRQGIRDWWYLASTAPGALNFERMPWDATSQKWYRWPNSGAYPDYLRISNDGGHPSYNHDVAREWVSPYEGTLRVFGQAHKEEGDGLGGNGVMLTIVRARGGDKKYLWQQGLGAYESNPKTFDVLTDSKPGDELYFIIGAQGQDNNDNTIFQISVELQHPEGTDQPALARWTDDFLYLTPTPPPPPAPLCYQPKFVAWGQGTGSCANIVGQVFDLQGKGSAPQQTYIRVIGPPAPNQFIHDFWVNPQTGGYASTAFSTDVYTVQVFRSNVRPNPLTVDFGAGHPCQQATVDFYQVPCQ